MEGSGRVDLIGPAAAPACRAIAAVLRPAQLGRRFLRVSELQAVAGEQPPDGIIAVASEESDAATREVWDLPRWLWRRGLVMPVVIVGPAVCATRACEARAARFIAWPAEPQRVVAALEQACTRFQPVRGLAHRLQRPQARLARLSARERAVLERIADGWWIKRIAAEFGTSPCTVRTQRASILQKLEVSSALEAALLVQAARWLEALGAMHD